MKVLHLKTLFLQNIFSEAWFVHAKICAKLFFVYILVFFLYPDEAKWLYSTLSNFTDKSVPKA
jgi:hypothetical protein